MSHKNLKTSKMLETLENDLKNLCMETRKKHPHIKDSCEEAIIKVRGAAANLSSTSLSVISSQVLYPLVQAAETKDPKIVKLALSLIQRLIVTGAVVDSLFGEHIVDMLWMLMENGIEELKVLQTTTLLLTSDASVKGTILSKALVLCFRLHFTKDETVNNTASATVKQLVNVVFERTVSEIAEAEKCGEQLRENHEHFNVEELKVLKSAPPKNLKPAAADAYLMFQDLVQLVNADQPLWLIGLTEMTRTFGLELLESVLCSFSPVFYKYQEFQFLLKDRVCALIIKLFSPNLKYRMSVAANYQQATALDKPYFPIAMRLLRVVSVLIQKYYPLLITQCEIFLSLMVKFLEAERPVWQRCLALEVLHKLVIQPSLIHNFCSNYDMKTHSTKIFQDIVNSLGSYIQSLFVVSQTSSPNQNQNGQNPSLIAGLPVGPGISPQPAFFYRGIYLPMCVTIPTNHAKSTYLDMLDKMEPPNIPDGYGISIAYYCLIDITRSIQYVMLGPKKFNEGKYSENYLQTVCDIYKPSDDEKLIHEQLINSSWCGLLAAFSLLLDASTDESATENILKSFQNFSSLAGMLNLTVARDAFITALCKSCLPPHYTLTVLNNTAGPNHNQGRTHQRTASTEFSHQQYYDAEMRHQVVAVGTALATSSLPAGAQQGPVMLTNKNLQCMRAILSMTHCHGSILGSAWHLVLTTLQHLVWILGLKPATGGSLKAGRTPSETNAVITTAVIADLPVLSAMLSRLFESSQHLDDVAVHHLIGALCKLSHESMELAYTNREPSLFAVAKLLETGLVNLDRVETLWRPISNHLLEVCQHPHARMREWGVEAITYLVKSSLTHKHNPPLRNNQKLQTLLLSPLSELSVVAHSDVRQKQLESLLYILHSCGELLQYGWPIILNVIGSINDNHSEHLIRVAFQCLQLVVTDFLPLMATSCLPLTVDTAAKFGSQMQELNISLTAIGLMWNISDYFYQNQERLKSTLTSDNQVFPDFPGLLNMPPFDKLWMCLYVRLGDLCVDSRPAVRKSAGQTLFSTIAAHGSLLQNSTWQAVLWQVLFPLLDKVRQLSVSASTDKVDQGSNILIHHSRNTQQKQWAETQVLTLSGVARVFSTKQKILYGLGDFPRAWALLLDFINSASLSKSNEVSLAALQSFQEMLQSGNSNLSSSHSSVDESIAIWSTAWKVWCSIGNEIITPPDQDKAQTYIPSQPFLTALVHIFPHLYRHIEQRFFLKDFNALSQILSGCVAIPVQGDPSFILPSLNEVVVTPLQDGILQCVSVIKKEITDNNKSLRSILPSLFKLLFKFFSFSYQHPSFGGFKDRTHNCKNQGEWVTMNFVPFAERSLSMAISLYQISSSWKEVLEEKILKSLIECISPPLKLKYRCSSQTTWKLAITTLLTALQEGLELAREDNSKLSFEDMWDPLHKALDNFLFSQSQIPPDYSAEDMERDENIDCQVVEMIREEILPFASVMPNEFIVAIMVLLNKGSIYSASGSEPESETFKLREQFAKSCFQSLLQFSLLTSDDLLASVDLSFSHEKLNAVKTTIGKDKNITNKLAVTSLLHRFKDVLCRYTEDASLSGTCPLPRHRIAEISFVLQAVATLLSSLKKAPSVKVDSMTWKQLIDLYPYLIEVGGCDRGSDQLWRSLRAVLIEYSGLLQPPNSNSDFINDNEQ